MEEEHPWKPQASVVISVVPFCGNKKFLHMPWTLIVSVCYLIAWRWGFPVGSVVMNPPANAGDAGLISGWEDPLKKEMTTHSSILAWEIPWTEEPGRLQSMGSQESQTWLSNWTTTTLYPRQSILVLHFLSLISTFSYDVELAFKI